MRILYAGIVYVVLAVLLFGNVIKPIYLVTALSNRLGAPYWPELATAALGVSTLIFWRLRAHVPSDFRPSFLIALLVVGPTVAVVLYADVLRRHAIHAFGADEIQQHSLLASLREAPEDLQIFLHAAALKNCVPYAWSYREMAFYRLPPNIAINVLPRKWLEMCSIRFQP